MSEISNESLVKLIQVLESDILNLKFQVRQNEANRQFNVTALKKNLDDALSVVEKCLNFIGPDPCPQCVCGASCNKGDCGRKSLPDNHPYLTIKGSDWGGKFK